MTPASLGVVRVNLESSRIEPLAVHRQPESWWTGWRAMVALGVEHIQEGTDHLLFLLVLLLPAPLLATRRGWGEFGGAAYSVVRLVKIVTAFTAGHSLTLLAGAMGWVRLPPQPVEVLIAFSILVSAVHAVRPVFPARERWVAGGFGLVHGLAFAATLADLNLSPAPLVLSILGFNLGIELMQLLVIALIVPWLILASQTPVYAWLRPVGAGLAGVAALGWMAARVTGAQNPVANAMDTLPTFAPVGLLLLALTTLLAYFATSFSTSRRQAQLTPQTEN